MGTAGETDSRPFTLVTDGFFACWEEAAEGPATDEGGLAPTTSGVEDDFFVAPAAEAYEGADEAAEVFGARFVLG